MKNICFFIGDINHSGGTERVTTLIANTLNEKQNNIFVLSLSNGDKPFFELNKDIRVAALFKEKISMKKHFFQCVKRIRKFLIENKIDTLIVVDSISCIFTVPALLGLNINHICWEHFNLKVNLGSKFRDLGRWLAAKWCTKIVTLTERDKSFWDEKFGLTSTNKVIAIANPSPFPLQDNVPSLEYKNILCVGRLTYQKGFDLLIPAWAKIADNLVGWKITIVGTGEDEKMLKQMAIDYKVDQSIDFVGQQSNMDQFYRKASFFCMSSRFEGLPMVLLEAQSYGLPIVAFDCETGPSELVVNNKSGFLVSNGNILELSNAIIELIGDDVRYEKFSKFAQNRLKNFYVSSIVNSWMKTL